MSAKEEIKRTSFAVILLIIMLVALTFSPAIKSSVQLLIYKVILANAGFLNGHVVRKLAFPTINWKGEGSTPLKILAIVIYAMFIYVYCQGG